MARRIGITTIRYFAYRLCRQIAKWTPAILTVYPDNTALALALEAANLACGELVRQVDEVIEQGI
jgi:hypothetical protein